MTVVLDRISGRLRPRSRVTATGRSVAAVRRPYQVLIVLVLLVAVVAVGVALLFREDRRLNAVEAARGAAMKAAESHAVSLLSYDYRTIEGDVREASAITTGSFREEYVDTFEKVLFEQARAQQTVVTAQVRGDASVVEADTDRVVALLFVNQATQKKSAKETKVDQPRVEMTLAKVDGKWLVSGIKSF